MAFDGSGNFNRTYTWTADAAAGTKILASRHDTHDQDLANGLSNTIAKDGQSSPTADIGFNAKKITNLADPVNDQDAVTKKYMLGGAATQGLWTKLGFASADMSLLGRAAGSPAGTLQRIAYNDKADGTGNDVFVVNDDGTVSARAADGTYKLYAPATAETRSRIVNGAMQISQENGNTASATNAYYAADQFYDTATTAAAISVQRVQSVTPNGSKDRFRIAVTTGAASVLATYIAAFTTSIEGGRIADFRWGTAQARQAVLRFGFKAPAGTYSIAIQNSAQTRSYAANFTISAGQANTDTEQTIVILGDTTGTWLTDTGVGLRVLVGLVVGTDRQGIVGWQAGEKLGTSANTNGFLTTGNTFELYDVGLYLDPDATGLPPKWTMPDEADEMAACLRYWESFQMYIYPNTNLNIVTTSSPMRVVPAVTGGGAGFALSISDTRHITPYQTTGAYQTLILSARM